MKWRSTPCTKNRDHSATSYDGPIDLSGTSTTTTHNVENCVPRSFRSVEFCRGFIIFRFFLFSEWRHESTFCFRQFNPSETVGGWCFFVCVLFICQGWWLFLGNYGDECIAHISVVLVVSSAFERLRHAYVRYVDMRGAFLRMWSGAMR